MILGDSAVGKTSILKQYVNKVFTGQYKVTIGSDFLTKDLIVENEKLKLQIWDTAGQEKYISLGLAYYRGADACMFVYDVTDKNSLVNLESWIERFFSQVPDQIKDTFPMVIAGNKCDKTDRSITEAMAEKWCRAHGNLKHFEVSAKTRQGIDEAFEYLGKILCGKNER